MNTPERLFVNNKPLWNDNYVFKLYTRGTGINFDTLIIVYLRLLYGLKIQPHCRWISGKLY